MIDDKLGIWGNKECIQCGACCYGYHMRLYGRPCEHQEIECGKSICIIHERPRERICETYFCGGIPHVPETTQMRERLREIANNLGSAPQTYYLSPATAN